MNTTTSPRLVVPFIRPSTTDDVPHIRNIYAHYVTTSSATFEEQVPSVEEMHNRRQTVLEQGLPFLVAELGGQICVRRWSLHH